MRKPANTSVSLAYGVTSAPYSVSNPHAGVDFYSSQDNKIYAPEDGRIDVVGDMGTCGQGIDMTSGTHKHRFCHTSQFLVSAGQAVKQGQAIAVMGETGYAFGIHLHWVMWVNGTRVNGMDYISKGEETMTPDALNLLAQAAWNKSVTGDDNFVKSYTGKSPEATIGDVLRSSANVELRTKAANYDNTRAALDSAYIMIERLKAEGQGSVSQAKIDALAKQADDLEQSIKKVNKE